MTLRRMFVLSVAVVIAAATASAFQAKPVDVTGVWTGSFTRAGANPGTAHIDLKQKGAELTGTAGPSADRQSPIANGKITTLKGVTSVVFDATQPNGPSIHFDLKLVEGHLKGKASGENNGQKLEADVDVARAK